MAASHLGAAATLHAAYEEACGETPLGDISISLQRRAAKDLEYAATRRGERTARP